MRLAKVVDDVCPPLQRGQKEAVPATDAVDRRCVLCGLLLLAHGVGLLFCARALQGVAVGLIAGAASAALHDLRPNSGATPVVSSAMPTGGQALGAIGASVLAQYAVAPTHLVWWLLLAAFLAGAVAVLAMPEPGKLRPGVVSSLRPQVSLPPATRAPSLRRSPP